MENKIFDVIILGGGPAGYTAALYAVRSGLDTLVVEKFSAGGQMTQTSQIDNYPGFDEGIDGFTLGFKMQNGAHRFGAETFQDEILSVNLNDKIKVVETSQKKLRAKAIIIAMGADHRHLGIENEEKLIGRGVGYCAACDGMFYRGKTVCVVGGGNSAAADALLLSKICKKVFLIHRRDTLRATKIYHDPLMKAENVEFVWNSVCREFVFGEKIEAVKVQNIVTDEVSQIVCDGVFISIGRIPETKIFADSLVLDSLGYIVADESTKTNIPGVFAAGDIRTKALRQVVTAASDGAVAAHFAEEYIAGEF